MKHQMIGIYSMEVLVIYIITGVTWGAYVEYLSDFVKRVQPSKSVELDNWTRLYTVILWPMSAYVYWKAYFKNKLK